jgi:hypothetical protein
MAIGVFLFLRLSATDAWGLEGWIFAVSLPSDVHNWDCGPCSRLSLVYLAFSKGKTFVAELGVISKVLVGSVIETLPNCCMEFFSF